MAVSCKCGTENETGLTRCGSCNAILPVKLGSKSEVRYERVRRKAELVGANCPKCGTVNPYTRFKCSSCGACRDCGLCVSICPESAISKIEPADGEYEYIVDEDRCIGCGFCAGACPCGVWNLVENSPIDD